MSGMTEKSKVVHLRSAKAVNSGGKIDPDAVTALLSTALRVFTGATDRPVGIKDASVGLNTIVKAKGNVGIKVNCLARRVVISQPALTGALVGLLAKAEVAPENVVIWERTTDELRQAGYTPNMYKKGVRCYGTDAEGVGYSSELYPIGSMGSLVSNILLGVDLNINLPVLKDHSLAGLAGGMKNNYGAIHNPNKYHGNHCNPYVAEICALPAIREKNRLTIIDCLNVQYHGGPAYNPSFVHHHGGLLVGTDPVAVDTVALSILEKIRAEHKMKPLKREQRYPEWLAVADKEYSLGHNTWDKIELIEKEI